MGITYRGAKDESRDGERDITSYPPVKLEHLVDELLNILINIIKIYKII